MVRLLLAAVIALLSTCAASPRAARATQEPPAATAPTQDLALACDASRDERARLAALLASGGALAGRALELPAGCKVLLGSPGAGGTALALASSTRITCAGDGAGFVLARRSCRGGDLPGAACDPVHEDRDCPGGGRCTSDVASGPFAPEPDATYTVIGAEAGALDVAVSGCGIWVNGVSGDSTALGGTGRRYGYCGDGPRAGASCSQQCSPESGTFAGFACTSDVDCQRSAPGRCLALEQCGASCGAPPAGTSWGPSGPGFIDPIDLHEATGAHVDGVTIHDHRKGHAAIRVGKGGRQVAARDGAQANTHTLGLSTVTRSTTDASTSMITPIGVLASAVYAPRPFVERGIVGGDFDARIADNHVTAAGIGIHAFSSTIVRGNLVAVPTSLRDGAHLPDAASDGLPGGIGIVVAGDQTIVTDNQVSGYVGLMLEPQRGFNVTVANNRFVGGSGSKIVIPAGSGARIQGNYLAWGSSDNLECTAAARPWPCCDGPSSGHCTGPGVLRLGFGDPGGRSGGVDHIDLVGNFLHSDQRFASYVLLDASGPRCTKGDHAFGACTSDRDCPDVRACSGPGRPLACCDGAGSGSCTSACRATAHGNVLLADNDFHRGAADQTALDLSRLAGDATTLAGMTITGNRMTGFGRGVVLPADARGATALGFTANDFTGTASSRTCTAPATPLPCCTGPGAGACAAYEGWQWSMGERAGDVGLTPADEQPTVVTLRAARDAAFAAGDAVAIGEDGRLDRARRSADVAGIALTGAAGDTPSAKPAAGADMAPVKVAVAGVVSCTLEEGVIAGAPLGIGAIPGRLAPLQDGTPVARALTAADARHRALCLLTAR